MPLNRSRFISPSIIKEPGPEISGRAFLRCGKGGNRVLKYQLIRFLTPLLVIAGEAKQSHKSLICKEIATSPTLPARTK